jgi:DNA ligase-1
VRFERLVAASEAVAGTPARSSKVAALADLLAALAPDEVAPAAAMLVGAPRQGRIGVGWRTIAEVDVAAAEEPSLEVADVDRAVDALAACEGSGSGADRARILRDLLGAATPSEQAFLRALLSGGLRQGALEGVMADAVARAAGVPAPVVRRAAMLTGDLAVTARLALGEGREGLDRVRLQVGRPVLPMLAATSPDASSAIAEVGRASVEWKLDGARLQVHRDGDEVGLYTRNLNDVTARLPSIVEAVRRLPVQAVVLDGEAVGFDEASARRLPGHHEQLRSPRRRGGGGARCPVLRRAPRRRRGPPRPPPPRPAGRPRPGHRRARRPPGRHRRRLGGREVPRGTRSTPATRA